MKRRKQDPPPTLTAPRQWLTDLVRRPGIDLASQSLEDALEQLLTRLECLEREPVPAEAQAASLLLRTAFQQLRNPDRIEECLQREQAIWLGQLLLDRRHSPVSFGPGHQPTLEEPPAPEEARLLSYGEAMAVGGAAIERRNRQGWFTLLALRQHFHHAWNQSVFYARLRIDPGIDPCWVSDLLKAHGPEHYWRLPARFHLDRPFRRQPPLFATSAAADLGLSSQHRAPVAAMLVRPSQQS